MATIDITGTIQNAAGTGVQYAQVRLSPIGASAGAAQAVGGVGIISEPIETATDGSGDFTIKAVIGFRYRLEIPALGFDRTFVAPSGNVAFHLLGLSPSILQAANGDDADGTTQVYVKIEVAAEATVRERYTKLVLEVADTLGGSYTTEKTWDLLAGKSIYEYTDNPDDNGVFYRAYYTDDTDDSAKSDIVSAEEAETYELAVSIGELKQVYLYGVDLSKDDGSLFPDLMFKTYLQAAVARLEKELEIHITPVDIEDEQHDHYAQDYGRWGYIQLHEYPLIQIDGLKFQYPSMTEAVEISDEWIIDVEDGASGVLQIVPGRGSIADVLIIPGSLMPLWSGASGRVPGIWKVSYRAGFEVGDIPADIKHIIAMWASIGVLNIAGDLIAGAGIATKSVSLPGLSQTVGTTSSATNSGYGARIIEYQKEIKEMLPGLKRYYGKNSKMVVV